MFRLIEEMPAAAFDQGVDWRWGESFDELVDTMAADLAVNVAPLVGHSVLRLYVMGDDARRAGHRRGGRRRCATSCASCLDAGAVGLSTSFVDIEDDLLPVPCRFAEHGELEALCAVLGERGRMLQIVHEFFDSGPHRHPRRDARRPRRRYGIPTTLSPLFHSNAAPDSTPG